MNSVSGSNKNHILSKLLLTAFIVTLFSGTIYTQQYKFEHLTQENGLSHNTVTSVLQDYKGYLWIGTYGGLNRYDGNKFTIFRHDTQDSTSIRNSAVKCIFEDSGKNLWIGCYNGGLNKFDREKEQFIYYPNSFDTLHNGFLENVLSIEEDSTGILWLGTDGGLCSFDPDKGLFINTYYDFLNNRSIYDNIEVNPVLIDKDNKIWVGTNKMFGVHDPVNGKFNRYLPEISTYYNKFYKDKRGVIWLGTADNGLIRFDENRGVSAWYKKKKMYGNCISDDDINALYEDKENNLWIGTSSGLNILEETTGKFSVFKNNISDPYSISNNSVYSIYKDNSDVLWIGTDFGINRVNLAKKAFNNLVISGSKKNTLLNIIITSITKDKSGVFWIGTWGDGIFSFDAVNNKFRQYLNTPGEENSLGGNLVRYMDFDKYGNLWIVLDGQGLNILDIDKNRFKRFRTSSSELIDDYLNYICKGKDNIMWIGSWDEGVIKCEYDKSYNLKYSVYPYIHDDPHSLSYEVVSQIFTDSNGTLWVATKGGGLNRLDSINENNRAVFTHYRHSHKDTNTVSSDEIFTIYEDKFKNIWVGTNEGGLCKFDQNTGKFRTFTKKDGLSDNVVLGILEDEDDNLWVSTSDGLSRINIKTEKISGFDVNDGLTSNVFWPNAVFKDETGQLFFGSNHGVNRFYPDKIKSNPHIPPVVITNLQIFNKPVKIGEKINGRIILEKAVSETDEITLSYKESVFSIEFAALDFAAPGKNKYMYRMKGFEDDWREAPAGRQFDTYTNLDPGEYVFQVKASNNDGIWNEEGTSLKIIITPPLWLSWWSYSLYLILIAVVLFSYMYIKNKRQQKEVSILKEADRIKSEFLAQMSHEIRSPVNVILSFSNLIQEEMRDIVPDDLKDCFSSINNSGKRIIRTIDLLLNMSEVQTGTYDYVAKPIDIRSEILEGLILDYKQVAARKKIDLKLEVLSEVPVMNLDEYTVNQIFANLIDNAIKYTETGEVRIIINKEYFWPTITVKDTGIGIKKEYLPYLFDSFTQEEQGYRRKFEGNGLGLALVKKYCEMNNATIEVESEKGKGTQFKVIFKNPNNKKTKKI